MTKEDQIDETIRTIIALQKQKISELQIRNNGQPDQQELDTIIRQLNLAFTNIDKSKSGIRDLIIGATLLLKERGDTQNALIKLNQAEKLLRK